MNPYEEKLFEVRQKRFTWKGKNNPYLLEEIDMNNKLNEWEENRKTSIKRTNNPSIPELEFPDFKLILHPRVKLIFDLTTPHPHLEIFAYARLLKFHFASSSVYIDMEDMHYKLSHSNEKIYVANVTFFFRDLSFIQLAPQNNNNKNDDLYTKFAHQFLLNSEELSNFSFESFGQLYKFKANVPLSQDPDSMLAQFLADYPGYMEQKMPLIRLDNLASKLFVQPGSCEPTEKLLRSFLSVFGSIRYLDISKDKLDGEIWSASVEYWKYDAFFRALKTLWCCSLRQEHSHELVDYEVSLAPAPSGLALGLI